MDETRRELDRLVRQAGATGAMLAGRDGILIDATLDRQRAEALSALVASTFGAAAGLGADLQALGNEPDELMVEGTEGTLHILPSGNMRLLVVLAGSTGNLGVIRFEMRQAAARLAAAE
jgi:uncharacterized protein